MTSLKEPLFMKNKEWYYFDEDECKLKLTDKATKEAIESYNEFYNELEPTYYIEDYKEE